MKITKLGHCCLLIEENNLKILTDPGSFTTAQNDLAGIDILLITHEHWDHLHVDSVKQIIKNNPQVKIFTNKGVGIILDEEKIPYELLEHGQATEYKGINLEGFGEKHAFIYSTVPEVVNTGYFIAGRFYYPGDALTDPGKEVEILALPVAGPWIKLSEAIDYARMINPKKAFPVHDGILKITGPFHLQPQKALAQENIEFIIPEEGKAMNF